MNRVSSSQNLSTKHTTHNYQIKNKTLSRPEINSKPGQRIEKLNDKIIMEALHEKQYKSALSLLAELESLIEKQDYTSNKKNYFYQLSVCYYNRAYLHHILEDLDQCYRSLQKSVQYYEIMQGYAKNREETVAHNAQYIKILLQQCAVLSQNGKHKQAVAFAEKSLNKLIQSFRVLQAICYEHTLLNLEPQTTQNTLENDSRTDRVDFKRIVIKQAEKMLSQLSSLPSIHKLVQEDKQHYEAIIKNIYFWKDNAQNNQKILRKQLDLQKIGTSPRNILGVQKKSTWIQQFHIGSLMSLKPKKIRFEVNSDTYYLLSSQNIMQMALFCSVCYFTIATQTRFNQFQQELHQLNISEKYKRLHKNDTMLKCKLLHIKSLQIAAKYLPPSNFFLNHLLGSFNKNYKFLLDEIGEQSEMTIKQNKCEDPLMQVSTQQYGIIKQQNKNGEKKPSRKRSRTNDKLKTKSHSKNKFNNDNSK